MTEAATLAAAATRSRRTFGTAQRRGRYAWLAPAAAVTGWMTWAYLRTYPRPPVLSGSTLLHTYGPWGYGRLAYSDVLSLYHTHHLANHAIPYVHVGIEYPTLTGLFMWSAAWVPGVRGYFLISAMALLGCAIATTWCLYDAAPRAAWAFALNPLLLVYSLLNWDLLAISLMVGGWTAWRRQRYLVSGVLFSLGIFAKFFPVVLFAYCALGLLRRRADPDARRSAGIFLAAAIVTAVVVNAPFAIANLKVWSGFFRFNAARPAGDGLLNALHVDSHWSVGSADALAAAIVLAGFVAMAVHVWRRGDVEHAAAIAFAWWMLFNKVFSPQYMLWVLVYAIVAEWSVLMISILSATGLADYVNSMMALHLSESPSHTFTWYSRSVFPWFRDSRIAAIACGVAVAVWSGPAPDSAGAVAEASDALLAVAGPAELGRGGSVL